MRISPLMDGIPLIDKPLRILASYLRGRGRVKQIVILESQKTQAGSVVWSGRSNDDSTL